MKIEKARKTGTPLEEKGVGLTSTRKKIYKKLLTNKRKKQTTTRGSSRRRRNKYEYRRT
jgi:hypothetical protein